jgi:hypothetical protein
MHSLLTGCQLLQDDLSYNFMYQMKMSLAGLSDLRAVCEKGLLLLAITIPEMEVK